MRTGQRSRVNGQRRKSRHQAADQAAQLELLARRVGRRFERSARQDQPGQFPAAFRKAPGRVKRGHCATHAMSHQAKRDLERQGRVRGIEERVSVEQIFFERLNPLTLARRFTVATQIRGNQFNACRVQAQREVKES